MGFLERLRQEKEAVESDKAERERLVRARESATNARRRAEIEERASRASQFYKESGIESLLEELRGIVTPGPRYYRWETTQHIRRKDRDSILDTVSWDHKQGDTPFSKSARLIVAETCPDGRIIIHGGLFGTTKISLTQWRSNKGVLESALEKAYKNSPRRSWNEGYTPREM